MDGVYRDISSIPLDGRSVPVITAGGKVRMCRIANGVCQYPNEFGEWKDIVGDVSVEPRKWFDCPRPNSQQK